MPVLVSSLACSQLLPSTVPSANGVAELTVPFYYQDMPQLNDEAILQTGNPVLEQYVILLSEPKSDLAADLAASAETTRKSFVSDFRREETSGPVERTIDGSPALEFVIAATDANGVEVTALYTVVDGRWSRFQVVAWTLTRSWSGGESNLRSVVDSFHEKQAEVREPEVALPPRPFSNPSGSTTVELPGQWEQTTELTGEGDAIQVRSPSARS